MEAAGTVPDEAESADEHKAVAVVPLAETGLTADASGTEGGDDGAAAGGDEGDEDETEMPGATPKKREPTPEEIEHQRVRHEAAEKLRHENDPVNDGRRNSHAHDATGGFLGMIGAETTAKTTVVVGVSHLDGEVPDSKRMMLVEMPGIEDKDGDEAESKGEDGDDGQRSARSDRSDEFASGSDDGDNSRGSPREDAATSVESDSLPSATSGRTSVPPPMFGANERARPKTFVSRMVDNLKTIGQGKNPFVRQKASKVMMMEPNARDDAHSDATPPRRRHSHRGTPPSSIAGPLVPWIRRRGQGPWRRSVEARSGRGK